MKKRSNDCKKKELLDVRYMDMAFYENLIFLMYHYVFLGSKLEMKCTAA